MRDAQTECCQDVASEQGAVPIGGARLDLERHRVGPRRDLAALGGEDGIDQVNGEALCSYALRTTGVRWASVGVERRDEAGRPP